MACILLSLPEVNLLIKINYIHQNPVEAGIAYRAEDYVLSSAAEYGGEHTGILDVIVLNDRLE